MKPVPRDDNGHALINRGTELFTHRISAQGTDLEGVTLATDFKEVMFHVEQGEELLYVKGTVEGSSTARLTQNGCSWTLPLVGSDGKTIAHLAAPSGTIAISVFAWR